MEQKTLVQKNTTSIVVGLVTLGISLVIDYISSFHTYIYPYYYWVFVVGILFYISQIYILYGLLKLFKISPNTYGSRIVLVGIASLAYNIMLHTFLPKVSKDDIVALFITILVYLIIVFITIYKTYEISLGKTLKLLLSYFIATLLLANLSGFGINKLTQEKDSSASKANTQLTLTEQNSINTIITVPDQEDSKKIEEIKKIAQEGLVKAKTWQKDAWLTNWGNVISVPNGVSRPDLVNNDYYKFRSNTSSDIFNVVVKKPDTSSKQTYIESSSAITPKAAADFSKIKIGPLKAEQIAKSLNNFKQYQKQNTNGLYIAILLNSDPNYANNWLFKAQPKLGTYDIGFEVLINSENGQIIYQAEK